MHACGDRPPPSQPPSRRSFILPPATVRPLTLNPDRASSVWLVAHAVSYRTNTVGYGGRSRHRNNSDRLAAALSRDRVATIGLTPMVAMANDPATVTQTDSRTTIVAPDSRGVTVASGDADEHLLASRASLARETHM